MATADERVSKPRGTATRWPRARRAPGGRLVVPDVHPRARAAPVPGDVAQSWQVRGGQTWLGKILPACVGACALLALAGAVYAPVQSVDEVGIFPSLLLGLLAALAGWLAWRITGTVWLVGRTTENELRCWATGRQWSLRQGEVLVVKGDAYGLFLVLVTARGKIWLWAQMDDRAGILAAIRRSSPEVEIDRHAEPRRS